MSHQEMCHSRRRVTQEERNTKKGIMTQWALLCFDRYDKGESFICYKAQQTKPTIKQHTRDGLDHKHLCECKVMAQMHSFTLFEVIQLNVNALYKTFILKITFQKEQHTHIRNNPKMPLHDYKNTFPQGNSWHSNRNCGNKGILKSVPMK